PSHPGCRAGRRSRYPRPDRRASPPLLTRSCYLSIAGIYYRLSECQCHNCVGLRKMDTAWFLAALDRAGVSQADLARHLRLAPSAVSRMLRSEEHTSELQSPDHLVCRLLLEKKK